MEAGCKQGSRVRQLGRLVNLQRSVSCSHPWSSIAECKATTFVSVKGAPSCRGWQTEAGSRPPTQLWGEGQIWRGREQPPLAPQEHATGQQQSADSSKRAVATAAAAAACQTVRLRTAGPQQQH